MTHDEIKILISAYNDGEVTPSEKNIVEEHLSTCTSCQKDLQMYKAMSSSLSKWPNDTLSPDEEIKVQKRFEQRRETMFTQRNLMAFGTTLALTIIIGTVIQTNVQRGLQTRVHDASFYLDQGRLKSAADDIGDQYSAAYSGQLRKSAKMAQNTPYEPYYMQSSYDMNKNMALGSPFSAQKKLGYGLIGADAESLRQRTGAQLSSNEVVNTLAASTAMPMAQSFAVAPIDYDRKIIKNADITLKVQNAQETQNELDRLVVKFNGTVVNLNINQSDDGSRRGVLVFTVLPDDLDNILRDIRTLGEVQSENQVGTDITNQYKFLQDREKNYKEQRDRLKKVLAKNTNNVDNNLNLEGEISNAEENINALETSIKQLDLQSYRATVSVNFYDITKPIIVKEMSFNDKLITTIKNNVKNTLLICCEIGINTFNGIIIVLSFLLPILIWSLIFWGVYLVVRRFFKK